MALAECEKCGGTIDPDKAIYTEGHWFCTHQCLGQWSAQQGGGVPA